MVRWSGAISAAYTKRRSQNKLMVVKPSIELTPSIPEPVDLGSFASMEDDPKGISRVSNKDPPYLDG